MKIEKVIKELEKKQDKIYMEVAEKNRSNLAFCEGFLQGQMSSLIELKKLKEV